MSVTLTTAAEIISIHALREDGDTFHCSALYFIPRHFYPRPPRGGRHERTDCHECHQHISIHALREEGDVGCERVHQVRQGFLSTPSARRAPHRTRQAVWKDIISIHALREEGDFRSMLNGMLQSISILALREEGDGMLVTRSMSSLIFLSTPSARRATCLG